MARKTYSNEGRHSTDSEKCSVTPGTTDTGSLNVTQLLFDAVAGSKGAKRALKAVFVDTLVKYQKGSNTNMLDFIELLFVLIASQENSTIIEKGLAESEVPKAALIVIEGEPHIQVWTKPDASDNYVRELTDLERAIFIRQEDKYAQQAD